MTHTETLQMFVGGHAPLPGGSCPTLDPLASIQISDELIGVYQENIDALINQLGKNVYLEFDPAKTICPNCEYDPINKRSRNIYKTGGPQPFSSGRRCPYCKGVGFTSQPVVECIKSLIKWNPRDAKKYGIAVREGTSIVRLKTYLTHAPSMIRANAALVNVEISDELSLRVKLIRKPIPVGLREDRYCVSFWELVQET